MKLDWRGDQLSKAIKAGLVRNAPAAGQTLVGEMTGLIDTLGPPRSSPGDPPHIDTGALIASIDYAVVPSELAVVVGSTMPYAPLLEEGTDRMAPRPFLFRALVQAGDDAARELLNF